MVPSVLTLILRNNCGLLIIEVGFELPQRASHHRTFCKSRRRWRSYSTARLSCLWMPQVFLRKTARVVKAKEWGRIRLPVALVAGRVLVMQPSISCPRCGGSGQKEQTGFWSSAEHCVICFGTGWTRTEFHSSEFRTIPLHSQPDRPTCTRIS